MCLRNRRILPLASMVIFVLIPSTGLVRAGEVIRWLEAESFADVGGWSRDTQHLDIMGSPYLLATGLGQPVANAVTSMRIPRAMEARLWVRCRDWLPGPSPGRFRVVVAGRRSPELGRSARGDDSWGWVDAGRFPLPAGKCEVCLEDLTGWWGRVDALVLATPDDQPPPEGAALVAARIRQGGVSPEVKEMGRFDLVVVGAGPAGMGASTAAARHGLRVALIQDRPVVGGNSSSEISVPPMGSIGNPPDRVNVTGLCEEFYPPQGWSSFASSEKMERILRAEETLSLFLDTRAHGVEMRGGPARPLRSGEKGRSGEIAAVLAIDVRTGQRMRFRAPLFIDATGHGWIGYFAGAEYRMGEESRSQYDESLAPVEAGAHTQGNTLYNAVIVTRDELVPFECPDWAYPWRTPEDFEPAGSHRRLGTLEIRRPENFDRPSRGKGRNPGGDLDGGVLHSWWVEYGGMLDTIHDAERIRDELLRINLGLWNYAKNHNPATRDRNAHRELVWLNHVPGVRESRRLLGPHVMTQLDFDEETLHPDTVAFTDWGVDVHHPEGFWVRGNDCIHVYHGRRVSIPYRSLYSRNIRNLMMAGRCHSASHIAMGGTRVMRPCLAMGQAAGTAAAIAVQSKTDPAGVHAKHLEQLQQTLLKDGCYLIGVPNRDPRDLALEAGITASSFTPGLSPRKVADGFSRIVDGDRSAWLPRGEGPHWIEFRLDPDEEVNVVHVTFERKAAVTQVETFSGGEWRSVGKIRRLGQRRYVLALSSPARERVRFTFDRAVGVCEIRLYHEPASEVARIRKRLTPPRVSFSMPDLPGTFLDDEQAEETGAWTGSTFSRPFFGSGYRHDDNQGKGEKSLVFHPRVAGRFEIFLAYAAHENRSTSTPVEIEYVGGKILRTVDQRRAPPIRDRFVSLGIYVLEEESVIRISTQGTNGYVVVDGVLVAPR